MSKPKAYIIPLNESEEPDGEIVAAGFIKSMQWGNGSIEQSDLEVDKDLLNTCETISITSYGSHCDACFTWVKRGDEKAMRKGLHGKRVQRIHFCPKCWHSLFYSLFKIARAYPYEQR